MLLTVGNPGPSTSESWTNKGRTKRVMSTAFGVMQRSEYEYLGLKRMLNRGALHPSLH
jgi:hypothetical protein